jgi:hypothetical protein
MEVLFCSFSLLFHQLILFCTCSESLNRSVPANELGKRRIIELCAERSVGSGRCICARLGGWFSLPFSMHWLEQR